MMESGSASLPPIRSLKKFIPDLEESPKGANFPLNKTWAHHGANSYYKPYDAALRRLYGAPSSVEDYCAKGHLVTADQHRAMFEAVNHRMWDITSGFTQWKLNSCWPSVQWQIFDWYLTPMVSYYYIKRACEPLHVQLSPLDSMVEVINQRLEPQGNLEVKAKVYDFNSTLKWEKSAKADLEANTYKDIFAIPAISDLTPVYFVRLELKDGAGKLVSDNFYWLSSAKPDDFTPLSKLPPVKLDVSHTVETKGEKCVVHVTVKTQLTKSRFSFMSWRQRVLMGKRYYPFSGRITISVCCPMNRSR